MMISQVKYFCTFLLAFAGFFWAWALKNTMAMTDGMLDLGLVSFGSVLLTSGYVLGMVNGGARVPAKKSLGGILFLLACLLVALNYALGAALGFTALGRPGFGIYCVVFCFLWLGITWYAHEILKKASGGSSSSSSSVLATADQGSV